MDKDEEGEGDRRRAAAAVVVVVVSRSLSSWSSLSAAVVGSVTEERMTSRRVERGPVGLANRQTHTSA